MESIGYARFRFVNGIVFVILGLAVFVQFAFKIGFALAGIPGYVLGAAFIALGIVRIRMGWPQ